MVRKYNFSAGPAALPEPVLIKAQQELMDWQHLGVSVMEVSHRSKEFIALAAGVDSKLRQLLDIPAEYEVLLLSGGARSQFAAIPLNLLGHHVTANYAVTGLWSKLAADEASRFTKVNIATNNYPDCCSIADSGNWQIDPEAAYTYYCDNETVHGVEFSSPPQVGSQLLVADMSSNLLSRPVDIRRHGLIHACAQKNLGISGVTVVIVRKDLLGTMPARAPSVLDYAAQAAKQSMLNTPVTFAWYILDLMLDWVADQGGVSALAEVNQLKANKLYDLIDQSALYQNKIDPVYRSRMNVVFHLADKSLEQAFLEQAASKNLVGLKGHRAVGGIRASIYNSMPEAGVDALVEFMREFEQQQ